MNISFTKMHGLGNDFMVIDAINQKINKLNKTPSPIATLLYLATISIKNAIFKINIRYRCLQNELNNFQTGILGWF
jgi:hypothetical protein